MDKQEQIKIFLSRLKQEHTESTYPFTVVCTKCGSQNCTIYHGCGPYYYSSYTHGFDIDCGLKCMDCGNASEIEVNK